MKELNKAVQDLKMEVETIKKTEMEATLEMGNLGKRSGTKDVSIKNVIQEIKERIAGIEDTLEDSDTMIKENSKQKKKKKKTSNPKHPGNPGHNEKTKPKNNRNRRE